MDYLDESANDDFVNQVGQMAKESQFEVSERWKKDQSKDFYLGMVAHHRLVLSALPKLPLPESVKQSIIDEFTKIGMEAAICAYNKKS